MTDKPETASPVTLQQEIDSLEHKTALFCLKVLALAGYISEDVVRQSIDLAKSVRFQNDEY